MSKETMYPSTGEYDLGEQDLTDSPMDERCVVDASGTKLLTSPGSTRSNVSSEAVNRKMEAPKSVKESGKME